MKAAKSLQSAMRLSQHAELHMAPQLLISAREQVFSLACSQTPLAAQGNVLAVDIAPNFLEHINSINRETKRKMFKQFFVSRTTRD